MNKSSVFDIQLLSKLMENDIIRKNWLSITNELTNNDRLRMGVWGILAIGLFYLGLTLGDYQESLQSRLLASKNRNEKLNLVMGQNFWPDRQQQSLQQFAQLLSKFHLASTPGVAKATLQQLLQDELFTAGFSNIKVNVQQSNDQNIETIDDKLIFWTFSSTISGNFNPKYLQNFLSRLSQNKWHYVIERLDIGQQRKPRFLLYVKYWFVAKESMEAMNIPLAAIDNRKLNTFENMILLKKGKKGKKGQKDNKTVNKEDILDELFQ